jgi:cell wall-associated NlpC family hydrolase
MAWSQEQLQNAAIIYQVGLSMGMSSRDIQIGLITAMVESNLVNVNYGDRDSLGLFQQRPSQGWGSPEQVTDPRYAASTFFKHLQGLGDKRYQMSMGDAAQAVQRSAFPDRYGERIQDARAIWPQVQQIGGGNPQSMNGGTYPTDTSNMYSALMQSDSSLPPTASQMLGAWGMPPADPSSGMGTMIGTHTNQSAIQPLMEQSGAYVKGVDGWRKAVLEYARQAVGTPYVWGGTDLSSGVDCSGFIQAVFNKVGMELPRVSYQQAKLGQRVGYDGLRPGDLIGWDNSSRNNGADHIALYLGNGLMIESPRPGLSVRIRQIGKDLEGGWGVSLNSYGQE